ncbi:MAG: DUF1800 family protein [Pseudomonadota bacterium]
MSVLRRIYMASALVGASTLLLAACSGGESSGPAAGPAGPDVPLPVGGPAPVPPAPPVAMTALDTEEEAARFLQQASVGATMAEIEDAVGDDAEDWLEREFDRSPTLLLPELLQRGANGDDLNGRPQSDLYWRGLVTGEDTLRQRMAFALSQILVVSDAGMNNRALQVAHYMDILTANAFGNYRTLLEDITYSPAMAEYLTYLRNRRGDPRTGRMPDENYARELLQLFAIGLVELEMDGTVRQGPDGPIEIFDNDDIQGLARVFTGLSLKGSGFRDEDPDGRYSRLQMFDEQHSELEKEFLGLTIPAGTLGDESISMALDQIFAHPNVAPFVSRQLIQRFTASNPTPDYVERVANAFEAGIFTAPDGSDFGTGERGDLEATLAAILLDPVVHMPNGDLPVTGGKVREPILKFVSWARAFDVSPADPSVENRLRDTRSPSDRLGQHPFRSPSVFNFYRPGFVAPGTQSGALNLTAPELQIINEGASVGYVNFMTDYVFDRTPTQGGVDSFAPDYSAELALADDPAALVDRLDTLLTAGRMTDEERMEVIETVGMVPISAGDPEDADEDRLRRVRVAVLMVTNLPAFAVIQ